ncbi:MAG: cell division protein ZipA C-terminal FtsZ-binding domain-containing protein [Burkholderiales bacterium]
MSDLQLGLLVIGACVVAGVYAFNVWQERQFRRRTEAAFGDEHTDVLMPAEHAPAAAANARIEPRMEGEPAPAPAPGLGSSAAKAPAGALLDPVIDYVVEVKLAGTDTGAALHAELRDLADHWNKRVLVAGYDAATGEWQPAGMDGGAAHTQLRFALQMSNRAGCIEQEQLNTFRAAVQKWAAAKGAADSAIKAIETELAHAMAVQLDRFCADVDIAIGVNVVARGAAAFSGTKIRALAEAGGMKLGSDGVFYLQSESGATVYTVDNHEPMPFMPEQMKTLTTGGITFLLDVPRVADAARVFEAMLGAARNFAAALDGTLVDDNHTALTDDAIEKIRRQLVGILAKMEAGQIAAGGARALRLFS